MSIELVTGHYGKPHIKSSQQRDLISSCVGTSCVLETKNKFNISFPTYSTMVISSGDAILPNGGHVINTEDLTINIPMSDGYDYIGIVGIQYYIDDSSIESADIELKTGDPVTTGSMASEPIYDEDTFLPLYRINVSSTTVKSYSLLYKLKINNIDVSKKSEELNDKVDSFYNKKGTIINPQIIVKSTTFGPYFKQDNPSVGIIIQSNEENKGACMITGSCAATNSVLFYNKDNSITLSTSIVFHLPGPATQDQFVWTKKIGDDDYAGKYLLFVQKGSNNVYLYGGAGSTITEPLDKITTGDILDIQSSWSINTFELNPPPTS